jgi:hypothetical protein
MPTIFPTRAEFGGRSPPYQYIASQDVLIPGTEPEASYLTNFPGGV